VAAVVCCKRATTAWPSAAVCNVRIVQYPGGTSRFSFQNLCGQAYVCIRKHASLLITLFSMMLSSGLPELQSLNDVSYLRKTLAVDMSEEKAIKFFQQQFYDAYDGSWTTKIDWLFHYLNTLKGGNS